MLLFSRPCLSIPQSHGFPRVFGVMLRCAIFWVRFPACLGLTFLLMEARGFVFAASTIFLNSSPTRGHRDLSLSLIAEEPNLLFRYPLIFFSCPLSSPFLHFLLLTSHRLQD